MSRQIIDTQDGSHSVLTEEFGVSYHSKYGAIQESMHVFIKAGLCHRAVDSTKLSVLGIGFGTGLNTLLTCLEAQKRGLSIHYTAVEAYPLSLDFIQKLNYISELKLDSNNHFFNKIHECEWENRVVIHPHFSIYISMLSRPMHNLNCGKHHYSHACIMRYAQAVYSRPIVPKESSNVPSNLLVLR